MSIDNIITERETKSQNREDIYRYRRQGELAETQLDIRLVHKPSTGEFKFRVNGHKGKEFKSKLGVKAELNRLINLSQEELDQELEAAMELHQAELARERERVIKP